ncbi:unnamed protein product [Bursaphelenchus okinawaensis]|uniref:Chondroitin proteoglycan 4 domain-containing protein n=1 Tax=Bursaphelenchus okinawaensis TaxID=465554 RepID=A0A811LDA3_9BILA|nr:unnamed protein product [Bursaphelenchus okinawaensis]CAG9121055.1 unnamed protein product [Bursaphelenchus okinawaensis]
MKPLLQVLAGLTLLGSSYGQFNSPLDRHSILDPPTVERTAEDQYDVIPPLVKEDYRQRAEQVDNSAAIGGCAGHCSRHFMETLNGVLEGSTAKLFRNFHDTCKRYFEAKECMQKKYYCQVTNFFDSISSGLQYLCEQQRTAMDALLPCVQENFASVRESCDVNCQPHALAAGLTVKHFLEKDFSFFKLLDKHMGTLTTNEACRVGKCFLKCYKVKLNLRCQGIVGSLLTEGITRPFSEIQKQGSGFAGMFQMFMPRQCTFLSNEYELNEFRIDPQLDQHITEMYSVANQVPHDGHIPNMDPPPYDESPLDSY